MNEQKPSTIEEAPSLADIKSAKADRLGRVDFTAQLRADEERANDGSGAGRASRDASVVSLTSMARPTRPAPVAGDEDAVRLPFILPPAKIDDAMAAEAARSRRAIAEARGEVADDEPGDDADDDEVLDEDDDELLDEPTDQSEVEVAAIEEPVEEPILEPAVETPAPKRSRLRRKPDPEPEAPALPAPTASLGEGLMIQDVASLADMAVAVAAQQAHEAAVAEEAERAAARDRAEAEAAAAAEARSLARLGASMELAGTAPVEELDDLLDEDFDELDGLGELDGPHGYAAVTPTPATPTAPDQIAPDQAVAEVAASVIALMRSTQDAHQRHLESVELEAARRCELLTAQAELDAELIRLHARREAHAIVSAARMRAGTEATLPPESEQLSEIGETFSRFAETIETTVALGPASPDQTRKP